MKHLPHSPAFIRHAANRVLMGVALVAVTALALSLAIPAVVPVSENLESFLVWPNLLQSEHYLFNVDDRAHSRAHQRAMLKAIAAERGYAMDIKFSDKWVIDDKTLHALVYPSVRDFRVVQVDCRRFPAARALVIRANPGYTAEELRQALDKRDNLKPQWSELAEEAYQLETPLSDLFREPTVYAMWPKPPAEGSQLGSFTGAPRREAIERAVPELTAADCHFAGLERVVSFDEMTPFLANRTLYAEFGKAELHAVSPDEKHISVEVPPQQLPHAFEAYEWLAKRLSGLAPLVQATSADAGALRERQHTYRLSDGVILFYLRPRPQAPGYEVGLDWLRLAKLPVAGPDQAADTTPVKLDPALVYQPSGWTKYTWDGISAHDARAMAASERASTKPVQAAYASAPLPSPANR